MEIISAHASIVETEQGPWGSGEATFDERRIYRYLLTRTWDRGLPSVAWIMLNPSTADAAVDDATISRVVGFSRSWGYGSVDVVNLFAYRCTKPRQLRLPMDPVGPLNDLTIAETARSSVTVIVAWGNHGVVVNPATGVPRHEEVLALAARAGIEVQSLGTTMRGQPMHPLYRPRGIRPAPFMNR